MASRAVDLLIAYRVIKLLVTPFDKQEAFKTGIIDKNGKVLKPNRLLKTSKEKSSYTMLHRFVFNLKRILAKVGLGGRIGSFATPLPLLVKEDKEFAERHSAILEETCMKYLKSIDEFKYPTFVNEEYFVNRNLQEGTYMLKQDLYDGDEFLPQDSIIEVMEEAQPINNILGLDIYNLHTENGLEVLVPGDLLYAKL